MLVAWPFISRLSLLQLSDMNFLGLDLWCDHSEKLVGCGVLRLAYARSRVNAADVSFPFDLSSHVHQISPAFRGSFWYDPERNLQVVIGSVVKQAANASHPNRWSTCHGLPSL
jgi:hypothetical protein